MRVITGTAKGRRLITMEGLEVRPTSDRVKESIFSILQFDIPGAKVLDLFAGSGQLGIEALSRGATLCVFVDTNRRAQEIVKENLKTTKLFSSSRVIASDYAAYLTAARELFDIALLDPPYHQEILPKALTLLTPKMSERGIIICEHASDDPVPAECDGFILTKQHRFGKVLVSVYRRPAADDE